MLLFLASDAHFFVFREIATFATFRTFATFAILFLSRAQWVYSIMAFNIRFLCSPLSPNLAFSRVRCSLFEFREIAMFATFCTFATFAILFLLRTQWAYFIVAFNVRFLCSPSSPNLASYPQKITKNILNYAQVNFN